MPVDLLRNKFIVIFPRIFPLSRRSDLATLQPHMFTSQNWFHVRFLDKVAKWPDYVIGTSSLTPRPAPFAHGFPHWFANSSLISHISPMATLTPGEPLGVSKRTMKQISAILSANSSPAPKGAQSSGNGVTGDEEMDDAWDEDDARRTDLGVRATYQRI